MRKPRIIIYDDEVSMRNFLTDFFAERGYEVLTFNEPVNCPIYEDSMDCAHRQPCTDLIITDFRMPKMNGFELLKRQSLRGCKIPAENTAVASGWLDTATIAAIRASSVKFFHKPFDNDAFLHWIEERESRMDLTLPLGIKRQGARSVCSEIVVVIVPPGDRALTGDCINASASGLCVRIEAPLASGLAIKVHSGSSGTFHPGTVKWVRGSENNTYLAGIQLG